jgi:hypothetical protein
MNDHSSECDELSGRAAVGVESTAADFGFWILDWAAVLVRARSYAVGWMKSRIFRIEEFFFFNFNDSVLARPGVEPPRLIGWFLWQRRAMMTAARP